jgi:hypothetical protein
MASQMSYIIEGKAHVTGFPPPFHKERLQAHFEFEDTPRPAIVSLTLNRKDIGEVNLRTNDIVFLRIENNSGTISATPQSDEFQSYGLRIIVRVKVLGLIPSFFPKAFPREGEDKWLKGVRVHCVVENISPPADAFIVIDIQQVERLNPKKDDILTIFIAKKYRSPNKS